MDSGNRVASHRIASHTVWPSDLAPDYPDVRAANLTLRPVNESNLLAQVEAAIVLVGRPKSQSMSSATYFAALVSSTPSILIKLCHVKFSSLNPSWQEDATLCSVGHRAFRAGSSGGGPYGHRINPLISSRMTSIQFHQIT